MNNSRVLVVDDDPSILEAYRAFLQPEPEGSSKAGLLDRFAGGDEGTADGQGAIFDVESATQGEEAVQRVRDALKEGRPFASAFIDIRMPPGIDGLETARRIRAMDDRIYIIIVTAYSDRDVDEIQSALNHDVVFLRKPAGRDEIRQLARNACLSWTTDQADQAARKELEGQVENLDAARLYLADIVSVLHEGIIVCSPFGRIRYMNSAVQRMTGRSFIQLDTKQVGCLFISPDMDQLTRKIVDYNEKPTAVRPGTSGGRARHGALVSGEPGLLHVRGAGGLYRAGDDHLGQSRGLQDHRFQGWRSAWRADLQIFSGGRR